MRIINKPHPKEYPGYTHIYMDLLGADGKILEHLEQRFSEIRDFVYRLPEEKLYYRYDTGKWTIKEILVHLIDDERVFAYRALRFARNDDTPLPGFEQDSYAGHSEAGSRSLESIFSEYNAVRWATITLFENLPETALDRGGRSVNGLYWSVRALVYHIAGHEQRHFNIIKERYL